MPKSARDVVVGSAKFLLRRPADALMKSATALAAQIDARLSESTAIRDNPSISAKLYPAFPHAAAFVVPRDDGSTPTIIDGLPVPPPALMEGYGNGDAEKYVQTGRADVGRMRTIAGASGITFSGTRILEFGCAAGRLLRHFADVADVSELRGVDISAAHIAWCQRHLGPKFRWTTTTTLPHLPFEDRYFDFIFAGSVFTHIRDLADTWLLELRRILKPGGALYVTVHDGNTIDVLRSKKPDHYLTRMIAEFDAGTHFLGKPFDVMCLASNPKDAMVFYDEGYVRAAWGREMEVLSYTREAYGYQSAVLLRREHAS